MSKSSRRSIRRAGGMALGGLLVSGIPLSAQAADIWINENGGIGATYTTSTWGARTGAYAEDIAADNHSVQVRYYRVSTANPMYVLNDTDGSAPGTYAYAERSGGIVQMQMCVQNSNPFDWQACSTWRS